ncbi:MAG: hypothetical protein IJW24_01510 [Clostridia bacterium]|nr:hypothetical protein [Clostridia bacterium]
MEFYNKLYLLQKKGNDLVEENSLFFKNSGLDYMGQFSDPDVFYSIAVLTKSSIILFDPKGFEDDLDHVCQLLSSLQDFTACKIVLCDDLPKGYEVPFLVSQSNEKITDNIVRISDCILRIIKEQKENPNNEKYKFYSKIRNLLIELGFDSSDLGFNYICDSVYYIIQEDRANVKIVGDVYKYVAKINETLDYRVERNIRHAIEHAMSLCDHKSLSQNENLKCFDKMMLGTTAKSLILALVGYVKYNVAFA